MHRYYLIFDDPPYLIRFTPSTKREATHTVPKTPEPKNGRPLTYLKDAKWRKASDKPSGIVFMFHIFL